MKRIIPIVLLFAACATPVKKHSKSDTSKVFAIYNNRLMGGFRADSIFRVVKDSTKLDGDEVVKYSDTTYYLPYTQPILDSNKRPIKSKSGVDSMSLLFYPSKDCIPHLENSLH